jgi:integrase
MIPETESMAALHRAVRSVDEAAADLVEWTAYTGQRPCNTRDIWWDHLDLPNRIMRVAQDKQRPPVDLSNEAVELLQKLKGDKTNPTGPVIRLTDRLQKKTLSVLKQCVAGLKEEYSDLRDMTDLKALRHYFASVCVMAGIDYKTIAVWLGHGDGGVLVAKTYGHLRQGHTKKQMQRISFSAQPSQPAGDSNDASVAPTEKID